MIKYSKTRERFVHGETIVSVKYQRKCRKRDACNPLSRVFLRNGASSANLTIVLIIVHLSCVYTILFLLSRPQYQLITPCVVPTAYGECAESFFFLFFSFSLFLAQCPVSPPPIRSPLIREFFANHNFTILNNHVKFPRFEVFKTELSCDSISDNHYNFFSPTIQINLCQDFQLISSSLKNGTTRQTRFQNNHPLRD